MKNSKAILIVFSDIVAVTVSFFVSLRLGYLNNFSPSIYESHLGPFFIVYMVWFFIFFAFGLYESENIRPTMRSIKNIAGAFILSFVLSLSLFYLVKSFVISPKTNLLINMVIFGILFILQRRLVTSFFFKNYREKILVIGEDSETKEIKDRLLNNAHGYYELKKSIPTLDEKTLEEIRAGIYDTVIISDYEKNKNLLDQNIGLLLESSAKFIDIVGGYEKVLTKIPSERIDKIWFISSVSSFRGKIYEITKRFLEVILSSITLLVLSPILILVFVAMKIEDGGKFVYSQTRVGKNGKEFLIYKIRSMVEDSEKNGPQWAQEKDGRVTFIGKFVRKTHLDEALQLINIIEGSVSFIGPRPERPVFVKELSEKIKNYSLRHIVKPGITGWAQIYYKYGNTVEDAKQKFEYDLFYIKNRNLLMDIGVLIKTTQKIFI